jgi:hypothetical protein
MSIVGLVATLWTVGGVPLDKEKSSLSEIYYYHQGFFILLIIAILDGIYIQDINSYQHGKSSTIIS